MDGPGNFPAAALFYVCLGDGKLLVLPPINLKARHIESIENAHPTNRHNPIDG